MAAAFGLLGTWHDIAPLYGSRWMNKTLFIALTLTIGAAGNDDSPHAVAPASTKETWWSFRPLAAPTLPTVQASDWAQTPVDVFVLARLEAVGLRPSMSADRATLIRRLTFDLHGLPPTPEEIEAFVAEQRPDAYERLVDRLLASPRYGERWGRHWLDVVHYGDTHGYDKDKRRDRAWPYRDYVIRSLNADKPYGQFIREQLAGDVDRPDSSEGIIATGFIAAGPWDFVGHVELREDTVDKLKTQVLDRDDMVANTFSTFQSLTVGCARCHDHKFDPILQKEYYNLQAVFAGVERGDRPFPGQSILIRKAELEKERNAIATRRETLKKSSTDSKTLEELDKTNQELARLEKEIKALPVPEAAYSVMPLAPRPIHRLNRGNVEQPRGLADPGVLTCLPGLGFELSDRDAGKEGARRAALAAWIANPSNPLTWRSIVNRVWHYHFGRGIVDTPNDFGANGSKPTHPELLDWLAANFRDGNQSLKDLHRMILNSATYRQASASNPEGQKLDAENRLLWRMNRQRLDAESLRDAVLSISGKMNYAMGGPGFELFQFKDDHSPVYDHGAREKLDDPKTWRRTVYRFVVRSVSNPFLECLDCADPNINTPVRNTTLTALQALALMNDAFMIRQSEYFAARVQRMTNERNDQVVAAYRLALGRQPSIKERDAWSAYVGQHGLANACRLIFNSNEFIFID